MPFLIPVTHSYFDAWEISLIDEFIVSRLLIHVSNFLITWGDRLEDALMYSKELLGFL